MLALFIAWAGTWNSSRREHCRDQRDQRSSDPDQRDMRFRFLLVKLEVQAACVAAALIATLYVTSSGQRVL